MEESDKEDGGEENQLDIATDKKRTSGICRIIDPRRSAVGSEILPPRMTQFGCVFAGSAADPTPKVLIILLPPQAL